MDNEQESRFNTVLGVALFVTALLYLFDAFYHIETLRLIYSSLIAFLCLLAVVKIRWSNRIAALLLLVSGTVIFWYKSVPWPTALPSFRQNMALFTLFLLVPYYGIIISIGGYLTALRDYIQEYERRRQPHPYRLSALLTATMGAILNMGAMPLVYRIAQESFSQFTRTKMSLVILRAFGFSTFWSPYFANLGLVLVIYNLSWFEVGKVGFLIAIIYWIMDRIFFRWLKVEDDTPVASPPAKEISQENRGSKLIALTLWVTALFSLSFTLDSLLTVNMLTVVSLLALIFPLFWAAVLRQVKEYVQNVAENIAGSFQRLKNELAIFISAGYFGVAISYTNMGESVSQWILTLSLGSIYLMSILVILLAILLSMFGLHPVIIIIGVGSALKPELFGVSPAYMAMVLILGWSLATQLSPFSGSVVTTAGLAGRSTWYISKKNVLFIITQLLILPFVLYLLGLIGLI